MTEQNILKDPRECLVEYKYDGVPVIAIVQNNTATPYSNGKILANFPT